LLQEEPVDALQDAAHPAIEVDAGELGGEEVDPVGRVVGPDPGDRQLLVGNRDVVVGDLDLLTADLDVLGGQGLLQGQLLASLLDARHRRVDGGLDRIPLGHDLLERHAHADAGACACKDPADNGTRGTPQGRTLCGAADDRHDRVENAAHDRHAGRRIQPAAGGAHQVEGVLLVLLHLAVVQHVAIALELDLGPALLRSAGRDPLGNARGGRRGRAADSDAIALLPGGSPKIVLQSGRGLGEDVGTEKRSRAFS
jgi:hypothetical protein